MFILNESTHRMLMTYHPVLGHLYVPNQVARIPHERGGYLVRTNRQGLRSDFDFSTQKGDKPRILIFGDSMTAGDGCCNQERFSDLLAHRLDAEVYNFGLSGSGTDQQLLLLEHLGRDFPCDLVVLCVYVENIHRIMASHRPSLDRYSKEMVLVPKPYFTLNGSELVLGHSPVPHERLPLARRQDATDAPSHGSQLQVQLAAATRRLRSCPWALKTFRSLLSPSTLDYSTLRSLPKRLAGYDPIPGYADPSSAAYKLMRALCARFIASAAPKPMLIVPLPMHEHFLQGLRVSYDAFFDDLCREIPDAHHLNLTSHLRTLPMEMRKRISFPFDSHFSPAGHQHVADILTQSIQDMGILGVRPGSSPPTRPTTKRHKNVLGISCYYHNAAACLVRDGEILAAAEEERFTRIKHDRSFPQLAANYCLEQARIDVDDLDAVVFYDSFPLTFERLLSTVLDSREKGRKLWTAMAPSWVQHKLRIPELIRQTLRYAGPILHNTHHRSHAASAFFPSPFERAAILTLDGVGEWATASIGQGIGNRLEMLKEMRFPHSVGLLYSAFTQFLGFKVNSGEYKLMGLAPYGQPRYVQHIIDNLVDLKSDGSILLNLDHFEFLEGSQMTGSAFERIFNRPARKAESQLTQDDADLARSIQHVTEEIVLRMAQEAKRLTGERFLCLAGGVALNCVANGRLLREGPFDDLWIQPAAGDAGGALGCALDVSHHLYGLPRNPTPGQDSQKGSYLGPGYSPEEIEAFLTTHAIPHHRLTVQIRPERAAKLIKEGKVLGHFSGRSEYGPRALGARSIIADPRNTVMQSTLNLKIKYRESFRPFAPSVLEESAHEYFQLDRPSPYMLLVAPVLEARRNPVPPQEGGNPMERVHMVRSDIPAVTHVDYSARVQTVGQQHPRYRAVLEAFQRLTGCGVIVNTSFNVRGEPIVNTPQDAYRCFMNTEMDALLLEDFLLLKNEQRPGLRPSGSALDGAQPSLAPSEALLNRLNRLFERGLLPIADVLATTGQTPIRQNYPGAPSAWHDALREPALEPQFNMPQAFEDYTLPPRMLARAVIGQWQHPELAKALLPVMEELFELAQRFPGDDGPKESVSSETYVMF